MKTKEKVRVAVKKIPHKSRREREHNYFEIAFLSLCLHKNIVHYIDSYLVGDSVWILMEYLEGGTLAEAANAHNFPDNHIAYVAREVISALNFLHSKNYAHRDLKSNNVMMSIKGEIKLIDFGLCADFSEGPVKKLLGSPFWIPPEMILEQPHSLAVDIWSLGVCILELYLREPPERDSSLKCMFTVGSKGLIDYIPKEATEDGRDFLSKCLEFDQTKRSTASELMNHPWVKRKGLSKGIHDILYKIFLSTSLQGLGLY